MLRTLVKLLTVLVSVTLIPCGATASDETGGFKPFVKSEHYVKYGHDPVALEDISPDSFNYGAVSFAIFKGNFERALGTELSDEDLYQILSSDAVSLVSCEGEIFTDRVNEAGSTQKFWRACYSKEKLIQIKVGDDQKIVASQGCLNSVFATRLPPVVKKPVKKPEPKLKVTDGGMLPRKQMVIQSPGLWVPECNCGKGTWLPGTTVTIN